MHRNAPLTIEGRRRLIRRIKAGWTITAAAESMNISRQCASKWWHRYQEEGMTGLADRSSRPHNLAGRTPRDLERWVVRLRLRTHLGPARLAGITGLTPSTVHRILVRYGISRLRDLDRCTGQINRIITDRPGELVHIDVKKLARIPDGGGHRMLGRAKAPSKSGMGYGHLHVAVDAYSRLAYVEFAGPEGATTCTAFLDNAIAWFADHGVAVERLLTDNGNGYRSHRWRDRCAELGIKHTRTKPRTPKTNGKAERFNRTLTQEWAYSQLWTSEAERAATLDDWLHRYNHHRHHTAIGGPPASLVTNLTGQNS